MSSQGSHEWIALPYRERGKGYCTDVSMGNANVDMLENLYRTWRMTSSNIIEQHYTTYPTRQGHTKLVPNSVHLVGRSSWMFSEYPVIFPDSRGKHQRSTSLVKMSPGNRHSWNCDDWEYLVCVLYNSIPPCNTISLVHHTSPNIPLRTNSISLLRFISLLQTSQYLIPKLKAVSLGIYSGGFPVSWKILLHFILLRLHSALISQWRQIEITISTHDLVFQKSIFKCPMWPSKIHF